MNLQEIKAAVDAGKTVYWQNPAYAVTKNEAGKYLIGFKPKDQCENYISLTDKDGITLTGFEHQYYIGPGCHPKDHEVVLKMIASRATNFPFFPIGSHVPEVFEALGLPQPILEKTVEADSKAVQESLVHKFRELSDLFNGRMPLASYPQEERFKSQFEWFMRGAIQLNLPITSDAEKRRMVIDLLSTEPGMAVVRKVLVDNGYKLKLQENGKFDLDQHIYTAAYSLVALLFG